MIRREQNSAISGGAAQHAGVLHDPKTLDPGDFYRVETTGFEAARRRFMLSLAGYGVISCVLGLGNRHFGNIMLRRTGELFHIDFDSFLGKVESESEMKTVRGGIKDSEAQNILSKPFHVARSHMIILGGRHGDLYREFEIQACAALNVLRQKKNATLILGLLSLMTASGLEQLKSHGDLQYIRDQLQLSKGDDEVAVAFRRYMDGR